MKIENQEKVWDRIACKWKDFRKEQSPAVSKFLKNKKGKILDLGCGSGRNFMKLNGRIYGIDFSKEMLNYAKKRAEELKIDAELVKSQSFKIPFDDNFFDFGICYALLHCLETKQKRLKTLKEFYRVLKPKGTGLVSSWGRKSPRLMNKEKECFIPWTVDKDEGKEKRYTYIYDLTELENDLKRAGFKIIKSWEERNVNVLVEK